MALCSRTLKQCSWPARKLALHLNRHSGRPVGAVTVRLAPGESRTVDFTFGKIVQHTEPQLSVTPTVQPLKDVVLDKIRQNACQLRSQLINSM
jgi:hypothetical protein